MKHFETLVKFINHLDDCLENHLLDVSKLDLHLFNECNEILNTDEALIQCYDDDHDLIMDFYINSAIDIIKLKVDPTFKRVDIFFNVINLKR